jgi:holo-[acyl-carrier protein] synthase
MHAGSYDKRRSLSQLVTRLPNRCHELVAYNRTHAAVEVIVGTGVDLCEVDRIRKAIDSSHGRRFVERVFTPREIAYVERKANPYERYAARFAAKEAGMKALGTGWQGGLGWQDLEVVNLPSGRPTLQFHRRAAEIAEKLGAINVALSITHTAEQALAMVILEGK